MKNTNSQVLRKTFAFSLARFTLVRFVLARFVLAAILIPALLIGSAFTFGGSNLQAQAVQSSPNGQSSKQGFFVGIVYLNGFKVDSTKTVTTNITTITDATTTGYKIDRNSGNNGYGATTSSIDAAGGVTGWTPAQETGVRTLVEENCKDGKTTSVDIKEDGEYFFGVNNFTSFDPGAKPSTTDIAAGDATVTLGKGGSFSIGKGQNKSYCYVYFSKNNLSEYQIATPDSTPAPTSMTEYPRTTSTKGDKLSGIGLQFGFRWEKWRASLTHFTGKGGANELANTLVMADYFVNKGLFVGGGLASMKLTNSLTSGSATSPAVRIGYKKNLTSNLSLNFGLTKYISGVSLNHTATATDTDVTPAPETISIYEVKKQTASDSATIGALSQIPGGDTRFVFLARDLDYRIEVTQVLSRTVYIDKFQIPAGASETKTTTTTETDAELKAPLVISLSLHLSF